MKLGKCTYTVLAAVFALPIFAPVAMASVTEKDVLVMGRVIGLLNNGPKGIVAVAVANGGNATQQDVTAFASIIGGGKTVGSITLTATQVGYDQIAGTKAQIVFIPEGTNDAQLDAIFAIAKARKLVTISTSGYCLSMYKCAISITSYPAVDIRMSVAAATATGVSFGSAFRMMIREVP